MANICSNWIEINGEEKEVKRFKEFVGKEFDFNKIIPLKSDSSGEAQKKWGCKSIAFDVICEEEDEDYCIWEFWTKWNPPTLIYKKLIEIFPDIHLVWKYDEQCCNLSGYLNTDSQ